MFIQFVEILATFIQFVEILMTEKYRKNQDYYVKIFFLTILKVLSRIENLRRICLHVGSRATEKLYL